MKVCMWEGVWKSGMCVCGEWGGVVCEGVGVHVCVWRVGDRVHGVWGARGGVGCMWERV